ncbi:hypothetical protein L7F22_028480 [Adiantum nelumboides]|nr:hypothetical protein [Adiantum nelumboides]
MMGVAAMVVMTMLTMRVAEAAGESKPEVTITNRFSGCQPRVECEPYEDDVLFRLNEVYSFTFDVNPSASSISCTVQCVGDNAPTTKLVTFVAATRGTSTKYFQWRILPDGGYVRWLDADHKVTQKYTKLWSF